jgi:hypothetical protein
MSKFTILLASAVALAGLFGAKDADACRCMQPDVRSSFANHDTVIIGHVGRTSVVGNERIYAVQVRHSLKGCAPTRTWIIVKTPVSSATCGTEFRVGDRYLIMGNVVPSRNSIPVISTTMCAFNKPAREITRGEKRYLTHVQEPCNSCTSDRDCDADSWCRETQNNGPKQCTLYATEGESCGGFTQPSHQERCALDLVCDPPANVPDAPGVCRSSCRSERDCDRDQYCATDNLCREDASCVIDADCGVQGNSYNHIMCVGYPTCNGGGSLSGGQCGFICGDPRCEDVGGIDFGNCRMLMGWAKVNGQCTQLSGCGDQGYEFFGTEAECQRACEDGTRPAPVLQSRPRSR